MNIGYNLNVLVPSKYSTDIVKTSILGQERGTKAGKEETEKERGGVMQSFTSPETFLC